jgi:hypothetical protein
MKTAWNAADRASLQARLARLRPEDAPRWGRMSAPQMVAHLADSLHMALGDLPVVPKRTPIRFTPLKQLIIYVLPFPKGVPTAPELISREPAAWGADMAAIHTLLDRFAARDPRAPWPRHPAFGRLSGATWGRLVYRHMDHHLTQFGV